MTNHPIEMTKHTTEKAKHNRNDKGEKAKSERILMGEIVMKSPIVNVCSKFK